MPLLKKERLNLKKNKKDLCETLLFCQDLFLGDERRRFYG